MVHESSICTRALAVVERGGSIHEMPRRIAAVIAAVSGIGTVLE
jgi:hypothetical protein